MLSSFLGFFSSQAPSSSAAEEPPPPPVAVPELQPSSSPARADEPPAPPATVVTESPQPAQPKTSKRKPPKVETVRTWKFDWLEFEEKNGVVINVWCRHCKIYYSDGGPGEGAVKKDISGQLCNINAYVSGTDNIKKDTATDHNSSRMHIRAVNHMTSKEESVISQALSRMDEKTQERLCKLFRWAYTIAYAEFGFTDFQLLLNVEKAHGVDLGETYANDKACRSFIGHCAGHMKDCLRATAENKDEPFYCALLFDGSTDKTLTEKEIISMKILEDGVAKIKLAG